MNIHGIQIFQERLGARIALRRLLRQQLLHDGIQPLWHRGIYLAHRRRILPQ